MGYQELIKKVQNYSGFSEVESKDSLEMLVESLSVHLAESQRREFAAQLPEPLQDIALSVYATPENSKQNIIEQFMEIQGIEQGRAKRQILYAWRALKEIINDSEASHISSQLSKYAY